MDELYKQATLIREFETRILELFDEGLLQGTTHTCIGQELIPVATMSCLKEQDIVVSNHRGHGHYIARTNDIKGLMAEIMGLPSGACKGMGGSQHLHNKSFNFFSNGVQGNMIPVAAGMAFAQKIKNNGDITACFIGDGTFGQGVLYETLNIASLWKLPLLIIVENNLYAQSTPISKNTSGYLYERFKAFDILTWGWSRGFGDLIERTKHYTEKIRADNKPFALECTTYRYSPHSKGDDYRNKREVQNQQRSDWYINIAQELKDDARQQILTIEQELRKEYEI